MLFLGALQGVPAHLYDAAKIDGAMSRQSFWLVIWPFITPNVYFILINSVIGTCQAFASINLMTRESGSEAVGGGPRWATTTAVYHSWVNALNYYDMGYAAAVAWLLTAVILVSTVVQFSVSRF